MPNQYDSKKCKKCEVVKHHTEFYTKDKSGRRDTLCKDCRNVIHREGYDPYKSSDRWLQTNYGISREQRTQMWEEQKGVCKICGNPGDGRWKQLCVDHDHQTGKVRDLLCRRCNTVLGEVYDDPIILNRMSDYLNRWKERQELQE